MSIVTPTGKKLRSFRSLIVAHAPQQENIKDLKDLEDLASCGYYRH